MKASGKPACLGIFSPCLAVIVSLLSHSGSRHAKPFQYFAALSTPRLCGTASVTVEFRLSDVYGCKYQSDIRLDIHGTNMKREDAWQQRTHHEE